MEAFHPYKLMAWDGSEWQQEIPVSRDEYVALKCYLHELRTGRYPDRAALAQLRAAGHTGGAR